MLKFIRDGKVVMEEHDNGKLNILDEKLKESFNEKVDDENDEKHK